MPFTNSKDAIAYAQDKANRTGSTWYVNGLASSGPMQYTVSRFGLIDTSMGSRLVATLTPQSTK